MYLAGGRVHAWLAMYFSIHTAMPVIILYLGEPLVHPRSHSIAKQKAFYKKINTENTT